MVPIVFDPQHVQRLLAALDAGEPLVPPQGGWTVAEMLMVAGAMHYALMAHGPSLNGKPASMAGVPAEHQEAFAQTYAGELAAAIETCSRLVCDLHANPRANQEKLVGRAITVDGQPQVQVGACVRRAA